MDSNYYSLGIDIGGTNTVFGLISSSGSIIKKDSLLTESEQGPVLLFDRIFEKLKIWDQHLNNQFKLKNIGVGVPNGNYYSGMVIDPPNLGQIWNEIDLVTLVKNYRDIPVKITNDANAAAMGEKFYGCLLYTSPSPRDGLLSRMPSSA